MQCTICQGEKSPYEFPSNKNKPLVCFDCNSTVECLCCGEHKNPMEFRVMGKICTPCKILTGMKVSDAQAARYEMLTGLSVLNMTRRANRREMAEIE
jgi:hypothetical protein